MRKVGLIVGALVALALALAPALAQQPFADVPQDHWAYNAVNTLAEKGLLEGYPDGSFKGKQNLTRYEFAQAIARMMDRVEQISGTPGPQGAAGAAGPPGPAGTGGGLTAEQKALLDRLAKEFAPELAAIRSDLNKLTKRVEDLESAEKPKGPTITVSGDMSLRVGMYGTSLGIEDVATTGYPFFGNQSEIESADKNGFYYNGGVAYGGINVPYYDSGYDLWSDDPLYSAVPNYMGSIPISDALKDSYKPSDFMTMKTRVIFSGTLNDKTNVKVALLAGPENNDSRAYPLNELYSGSPDALTGNGIMDLVNVDEAWMKFQTRLITPMEATIGKQYFKRGVGLLADNGQEALKGMRFDWTPGGRLSWGAFLGMLDNEMFYGTTTGAWGIPGYDPLPTGWTDPKTNGQDNYNLYYLGFCLSDSWKFGLNWLDSGFNKEQGWSASVCGKLYGLDLYSEYAKLTRWPTGDDFVDWNGNGVQESGEVALDESDSAWMLGLKWTSPAVVLTGEYGQVDAGYAFTPAGGGWSAIPGIMQDTDEFTFNLPLSALHPNAEVDPHDINWVDRPLFLDPTNIAKGWHVNVAFPELFGKNMPVSVSYMSGDAYEPRYLSWLGYGGPTSGIAEPDKWTDADPVWVVRVSKQLAGNVTLKLLYARREADNVLSRQLLPIDVDGQTPIYAESDPIQVIRAEFCVPF
jgi:hypothetical protein